MADLSVWPVRDALRFHQSYRLRRPGGHGARQSDVVRYAGKLGRMVLCLPGLPASYQLTADGCLDAALRGSWIMDPCSSKGCLCDRMQPKERARGRRETLVAWRGT
jgi:hypothetical protein